MEKPKSKTGICEYHLCKKETEVFLCKYCKRYFCKEHIDPKPVLTFRQVFTAKEPLRSKLEEFWRSEKGHPDYVYTQIFWEKIEEEERTIMRKMWEALDRLNEQRDERKFEEMELSEIPGIEKEKKSSSSSIIVRINLVTIILFILIFILIVFFFIFSR